MAGKGYIDTDRQVRSLIEDARQGIFKSVYLLMGEEPYYPDLLCQEIIDHCLQEWEKDFNETICYGGDVDAETVITAARRFPMMAERQLVVVKEAQQMKSLEELAVYCQQPLDSTVLVILLHGASADKRRGLYKAVQKTGVVVESALLRDYEMPQWISSYYTGRGLSIHPEAAQLLAESAGTDLGKIAVETEKLLKNLPEGTREIKVEDVENICPCVVCKFDLLADAYPFRTPVEITHVDRASDCLGDEVVAGLPFTDRFPCTLGSDGENEYVFLLHLLD